MSVFVYGCEMPQEMQQEALYTAREALREYFIEGDIAACIKIEFDRKFGPTWHCIVGVNFGMNTRYCLEDLSKAVCVWDGWCE